MVMTIPLNLHLENIARSLSEHTPQVLSASRHSQAAVAMILREGPASPEVLFILRAEHEKDPWSGNIGFPGGKLNGPNESPQQAAERETFEELSLNLQQSRHLGRLDDLYGANLPVLVSCFVYLVTEPVILQPNHEVATTFWTPISTLLDKERHQERTFSYQNEERDHPTVQLLDPQQPLLWGITYRLIRNFCHVCSLDFGLQEPPTANRT